MSKNIAAHTDPGCSYPPYISINTEDDGRISITVRSAAVHGFEGTTANIVMSSDTYRTLLRDMIVRAVVEGLLT